MTNTLDLNTIVTNIFNFLPTIGAWITNILQFLIGLSFPLALFFFIGIIYCVERLKEIRIKEVQLHDLKVEEAYDVVDKVDPNSARRWENVERLIESPNQNDWKQAIIEADVMLDNLLNKMEYRGDSVGEKLKHVEKGDFKSLDEAWEAHKVRNQIAHDGLAAALSQYEAKRVINMYKKVFEEFYFI